MQSVDSRAKVNFPCLHAEQLADIRRQFRVHTSAEYQEIIHPVRAFRQALEEVPLLRRLPVDVRGCVGCAAWVKRKAAVQNRQRPCPTRDQSYFRVCSVYD